MAKPNYRQQKKSKEHARKLRQAEKQQKRQRTKDDPMAAEDEPEPSAAGEVTAVEANV
jgi:hypothetical protein